MSVLRLYDFRSKTFLLKMRAPKRLKSADDDSQCLHNPSIYLSSLIHTASSKTCLTSWRPMQLKSHALSDKKHNHQSNLLIGSDTPNDEVGTSECLRVGPNIYVAVAAAHFKLHFGHPGRKKEIRYNYRVGKGRLTVIFMHSLCVCVCVCVSWVTVLLRSCR